MVGWLIDWLLLCEFFIFLNFFHQILSSDWGLEVDLVMNFKGRLYVQPGRVVDPRGICSSHYDPRPPPAGPTRQTPYVPGRSSKERHPSAGNTECVGARPPTATLAGWDPRREAVRAAARTAVTRPAPVSPSWAAARLVWRIFPRWPSGRRSHCRDDWNCRRPRGDSPARNGTAWVGRAAAATSTVHPPLRSPRVLPPPHLRSCPHFPFAHRVHSSPRRRCRRAPSAFACSFGFLPAAKNERLKQNPSSAWIHSWEFWKKNRKKTNSINLLNSESRIHFFLEKMNDFSTEKKINVHDALIDWLIELNYFAVFSDWLIDWLSWTILQYSLIDRLIDWLNWTILRYSLTDWLIDWLTRRCMEF